MNEINLYKYHHSLWHEGLHVITEADRRYIEVFQLGGYMAALQFISFFNIEHRF